MASILTVFHTAPFLSNKYQLLLSPTDFDLVISDEAQKFILPSAWDEQERHDLFERSHFFLPGRNFRHFERNSYGVFLIISGHLDLPSGHITDLKKETRICFVNY